MSKGYLSYGNILDIYGIIRIAGFRWQVSPGQFSKIITSKLVTWSPTGVPGAQDNVMFGLLSSNNDIVVTLKGDITVNSLTIDTHGYLFKSGSLTIQNDCMVNAGTFYKMNITLNGNSSFESTGSGGFSGIMCDSCVINVKNSLVFISKQTGNTEITNRAVIVVWPGAAMTIWYDAMHSAMSTPLSTVINYGTLLFGAGYTFGSTPWGVPPITATGPWKELRNYGEIGILIRESPIGSFVYNDFQTWNFLDGKITLRVVQDSSTNAEGQYSSDDEFNDGIGPCAGQETYEVNIGGDVHIIFDQAETFPGQPEMPFNPKVGDFFPVFSSFQKYTGKFRKIPWEGLGSGMALGRMTRTDPNNGYFHVGVVICAESDTTCIDGSAESPTGGPQPPSSNVPSGKTPSGFTSSASYLQISTMAIAGLLALIF